jgi:hypothetical protein
MLSRFSSLFTYVIAGLVISAAATPMGGPLGGLTGDGAKSLTHPGSSSAMKPYDNKPYGDDKRRPYADDKRKPYDVDDKRKPYDVDDKRKPYDDDDKRKPYDDNKDKSYNDQKAGQCSVGEQHCCNQVNKVNHYLIVISINH